MGKPDFSRVRNTGSELITFFIPSAFAVSVLLSILALSARNVQPPDVSHSTGGGEAGGANIADYIPPVEEIDAAQDLLLAEQLQVTFSEASKIHIDTIRQNGTCAKIGSGANSVFSVLSRELEVGELSPASDNIWVFVVQADGKTIIRPYGDFRIGAENRAYVQLYQEVCIDKGLVRSTQ